MFVQLTQEYLGNPPGKRIAVHPADAQQLIQQGIAVAVPDDPVGPAVSQALDSAMTRFGQALESTLTATLKQFADTQGRSRRNAVPLLFGSDGEGDARGKSFGDWLLCVARHDVKTLADKYQSHLTEWDGKAGLTTSSGTQGGFTVPTEFVDKLYVVAAEQAVVRPRATVIPMNSRSIQVPYLDVTATPTAGESALFGGLVARWTEEAAALTETEPSFKQVELVAHELAGYSLISNQLLADNAVGLEAILTKLFGGALAWFEDYAFLRGDGVAKPLGVVGTATAAAIAVTRASANAFSLADAGTMLGRLLPGWNPRRTVWVIHPTVLQQCIQMVSSAAGVGWLPNLTAKVPMQLLGIPLLVSEKLAPLGTPRDVLLCDFSHYLIGDRQQVEIAFSEHFKFTNNQGTWRFVARVDGQPWLRAPVTLADAATTLSPFLYLN
ncbi:MAG: phage major capsid protein [Gemmataceae bacterium]